MTWKLVHADCLDALKKMPDNSVDSIVTDPPAGISFMGKTWDTPTSYGYSDGARRVSAPPTVNLGRNPTCQVCGGRKRAGAATKSCTCESPSFNGAELVRRDRDAFVAFISGVMRECLRVIKPGGHALVWAIPRTSHWTATAIEDVGFEIRDVVTHLFGTGFPKSMNVAKKIDERLPPTVAATPEAKAWEGWGTALKPASEHWILARKPLIGTVVKNVLTCGAGALNVDGCRIGYVSDTDKAGATPQGRVTSGTSERIGARPAVENEDRQEFERPELKGRWPANITLDEEAAAALDEQSGTEKLAVGASRFFYCAKAAQNEKTAGLDGEKNTHPTVKSLALMRWLTRLVTPPGGVVLDPFAGSGSTGCAAVLEGFSFVGIEREQEYIEMARKRISYWEKKK